MDELLDLDPALRDECCLMLQYNDGRFRAIKQSKGKVLINHNLCEVDDNGEIDIEEFIRQNSIEYDDDDIAIEILGKRKREAVKQQERNAGRHLSIMIPLQMPEQGGKLVFPNT